MVSWSFTFLPTFSMTSYSFKHIQASIFPAKLSHSAFAVQISSSYRFPCNHFKYQRTQEYLLSLSPGMGMVFKLLSLRWYLMDSSLSNASNTPGNISYSLHVYTCQACVCLCLLTCFIAGEAHWCEQCWLQLHLLLRKNAHTAWGSINVTRCQMVSPKEKHEVMTFMSASDVPLIVSAWLATLSIMDLNRLL